jgi:copper chaperone CopZ
MEPQIIKFTVADMSCGACVARIRGALKQVSLPSEVEVDIDLAQHQVILTKGANPATAKLVREAIEEQAIPLRSTTQALPLSPHQV